MAGYSWSLVESAKKGDVDTVRIFLELGVDPNCIDGPRNNQPLFRGYDTADEDGHTPLYWASRHGHVDVVNLLIEAGADPNFADEYDEMTPLYSASMHGNVGVVKLLLEVGAAPNLADMCGYAPLHWASYYGYAEVVRLLLEAGADLNFANKNGETSLCLARKRELAKVEDMLTRWPRVVPLVMLCIRVIKNSLNKVSVPTWVPPVLLEYPSIENEDPSKKQK